MSKSRAYCCDDCMVYFAIEVEPGKSESEMAEFPKSQKWLRSLKGSVNCPSCGESCEEET